MCATLWYVRFNLGFEIWPGGGGGGGEPSSIMQLKVPDKEYVLVCG